MCSEAVMEASMRWAEEVILVSLCKLVLCVIIAKSFAANRGVEEQL